MPSPSDSPEKGIEQFIIGYEVVENSAETLRKMVVARLLPSEDGLVVRYEDHIRERDEAVARERERLARDGGDLPEAFAAIDPESDVGVLIRAALTVAEEDERERIREALLGEKGIEVAGAESSRRHHFRPHNNITRTLFEAALDSLEDG